MRRIESAILEQRIKWRNFSFSFQFQDATFIYFFPEIKALKFRSSVLESFPALSWLVTISAAAAKLTSLLAAEVPDIRSMDVFPWRKTEIRLFLVLNMHFPHSQLALFWNQEDRLLLMSQLTQIGSLHSPGWTLIGLECEADDVKGGRHNTASWQKQANHELKFWSLDYNFGDINVHRLVFLPRLHLLGMAQKVTVNWSTIQKHNFWCYSAFTHSHRTSWDIFLTKSYTPFYDCVGGVLVRAASFNYSNLPLLTR